VAKIKRKRVGRRQPRRGETWKQKLARVGKLLIAEDEEGREARQSLRGIVKDLKAGKDPVEMICQAFNVDEGMDCDEDTFDRMRKTVRETVRKTRKKS